MPTATATRVARSAPVHAEQRDRAARGPPTTSTCTRRTCRKPNIWQWYVEQFSPTELHHHAIEETYFSGRTAFQDVAVIRTDGVRQDARARRRHAEFASRREDLSRVARASGARGAATIAARSSFSAAAKARRCARRCGCPDVRRCTMVDIDGDVVDLSKRYLAGMVGRRVRGSAGARHRRRRARISTRRPRPYGVDRLRSDRTAGRFALQSALLRRRLHAISRRVLTDGGVYVLQASTAGFHNMRLHAKMARTLRKLLSRTCVRFTRTCPPSITTGRSSPAATRVDVAALPAERIDAYVAGLRGENYLLRRRNASAALQPSALPAARARRRRATFLSEPAKCDRRCGDRTLGQAEGATSCKTLDLHLGDVERRKAQHAHAVPVEPSINGAGAIHGGAIVSLCDTAFMSRSRPFTAATQDDRDGVATCSFLRAGAAAARSRRATPRCSSRASASCTVKCTCTAARNSSRTRR